MKSVRLDQMTNGCYLCLLKSAAIAIENAQAYREEQSRRFAAEGMQQILAQLSSDQQLDEILTGVLKLATGILHLDGGALYLITPGNPKPTLLLPLI